MAHNLTCAACGRAFTARRGDAVTCSTSCRVTHWRRQQRAELLRLRAAVADSGAPALASLAHEAERVADDGQDV